MLTAMLTAIKHYFARRRLGPVVAVLPFALSRSFGNAEFYTLPQAQKTIAALKIKPALLAYAHVVALETDDAVRANPTLNRERCAQLRREIAEAFHLPDEDFTSKDLRRFLRDRRRTHVGEPSSVPSVDQDPPL